tara:strand:- start:60 stop:452 length:393 start_codon:yes stop_codon:yes gene_type:complete
MQNSGSNTKIEFLATNLEASEVFYIKIEYCFFDCKHKIFSVRSGFTQKGWNDNLVKLCEDLELSIRTSNCLQNAGIEYVYQLVQKTDREMLKIKNFGRKSFFEIKEILSEMNLQNGMYLDPEFIKSIIRR